VEATTDSIEWLHSEHHLDRIAIDDRDDFSRKTPDGSADKIQIDAEQSSDDVQYD